MASGSGDRARPPVKQVASLVRDTYELWSSRNAFQHAGALAFYTLFSLAPLLIILIAIVGAVFGEEAARGEVSAQIDDLIGSEAALAVEDAVRSSRVEEAGVLPTLLGVAALLFASTTVFAQMQASLNQFWGVVARPSRSGLAVFVATRLVSLGLVLVIGFLLLTSFAVSTGINAAVQYAEDRIPVPGPLVAALDLAVSLLVATVLFALIFKILPDVRLAWSDVRRGALVTAVLFVTGRVLISLYLAQTAPASAFGAAGALVLVLMWVYYSALILFFGAALTRVELQRRGAVIVPKPTAVRLKVEILDEAAESEHG